MIARLGAALEMMASFRAMRIMVIITMGWVPGKEAREMECDRR